MTFLTSYGWNTFSEGMLGVVGVKGTGLMVLTLLALWLLRRQSADAKARIANAATFSLLAVGAMGLLTPGLGLHALAIPRVALQTSVGEIARAAGISGTFPAAGLSIVALIAAIWLAGVLAFGLHFILSIRKAARVASRSDAITEPHVLRLANATWRLLGVKAGSTRLAWTDELSCPAVIGALHPVVLLPRRALDWDDEALRAALLHEIAHATRRDYVWLLAAELARTVFWMNPLVHHAVSHLRRVQDEACDDLAIQHGMTADGYARQLVTVARSILQSAPRLVPSMARKRSEIVRRIGAIMQPDAIRASASFRFNAGLFLAASVVSGGFGALYPWHCT
jgi:beta-lactamase regulating signal transducer with metallopeptidase domain